MRYLLLLVALITSTAFAAPDFDETMTAAKQGEAYAQFNLGVMYANGEGAPKNDAEAVK
jgi:TPR repeat protein